MPGRWERLAPITGLVAVVLIAAAFIVGGEPPDVDAPAGEIVSYYEGNDTETGIGSTLLALGAAFFVFFTTLLVGALRRPDDRGYSLGAGVLAGGVMMAVGMLIFAGIGLTLSDVGADLEPAAAQTLNALSMDMFFPVAGGTVVFSWCASLAILRNGGLPRWLGWIALVIAIAAVTPAGFFAFLAIGLWTLIVTVVMLTSGRETAARA
jgi:hypothetical protein